MKVKVKDDTAVIVALTLRALGGGCTKLQDVMKLAGAMLLHMRRVGA